jgi:anhydro-N-acetylmuramic acid kinase
MKEQKNPSHRLIAGAMSGTSADGVDVAIVAIQRHGLEMSAKLLEHRHEPYEQKLKDLIFSSRSSQSLRLGDLAKMGREISLAHASAIQRTLRAANLLSADLSAVAAHGQTLFHEPPTTIQWFDPALVAAEVGCTVISDFRRADCAVGGQGAPLVPFADYILFRHPAKNRVLLNLGGIANITWLKAGGSIEEVIAFDTGPGNCVLDSLARKADLPGGIDRNGALSAAGHANDAAAVAALNAWKYATHPPPKSADIPELIHGFELSIGRIPLSLPDQLATACRSSAIGVRQALTHLPGKPHQLIVSGGGVYNVRLIREIEEMTGLKPIPVDELGIPAEAKEAVAFALLGAATLDGIPSNVPSVTGAKRPVILGAITPKP